MRSLINSFIESSSEGLVILYKFFMCDSSSFMLHSFLIYIRICSATEFKNIGSSVNVSLVIGNKMALLNTFLKIKSSFIFIKSPHKTKDTKKVYLNRKHCKFKAPLSQSRISQ